MEAELAVTAGLCAAGSVFVWLSIPTSSAGSGRWVRVARRWWAAQDAVARGARLAWMGGAQLLALQLGAGAVAGCLAMTVTGLPVMVIAGFAVGVSLARAWVGARGRARLVERQDAVLDSVRMLRQLLDTGAAGVNQALAAVAERGPVPLRAEFRGIVTRSVGRRQAWREARERVAEPLFDMLAAAVLIQRPGGGELAPLFGDLEVSVTAAQEVEREARALQAQARSASTFIVALPLAFILALSALHSPYLDAYHDTAGQLFLLAMLGIMGFGHQWVRRLLDLPGLQRVRLIDA